jgi:S-(hydroxymethyl)glutathione dehydrogenase/alcohol dehydrogenase
MPLDQLVSRRVALDEVNEAFADLSAGRGVRTVIVN